MTQSRLEARFEMESFLSEGYLVANPPELQKLCINTYRLLARGEPVSLVALTEATSCTVQKVEELIALIPSSAYERRLDGDFTGFIGLSVEQTAHQFIINDRTLYVWCVFDALFLPALLQSDAILKTRCPATCEEIVVQIDAEQAAPVTPGSPVMSIIAPDHAACCRDLRGAFCDHVNFFADERAFKRANIVGVCISLDEAFEFASKRNCFRFPDVDWS